MCAQLTKRLNGSGQSCEGIYSHFRRFTTFNKLKKRDYFFSNGVDNSTVICKKRVEVL